LSSAADSILELYGVMSNELIPYTTSSGACEVPNWFVDFVVKQVDEGTWEEEE